MTLVRKGPVVPFMLAFRFSAYRGSCSSAAGTCRPIAHLHDLPWNQHLQSGNRDPMQLTAFSSFLAKCQVADSAVSAAATESIS